MIYKFRVIFDTEKDDIFRDIALEASATLEDLHNVIVQSFGFDGTEMASFYLSDDDWNQGEEFQLFDMSEEGNAMSETILESILNEDQKRLLYVYDFLSMWTFFVELMEVDDYEDGVTYPILLQSYGQMPAEAPDKNFVAEDFDEFGSEFDEFDMDDEDFDQFEDDQYY